jgi:hypothetical protein
MLCRDLDEVRLRTEEQVRVAAHDIKHRRHLFRLLLSLFKRREAGASRSAPGDGGGGSQLVSNGSLGEVQQAYARLDGVAGAVGGGELARCVLISRVHVCFLCCCQRTRALQSLGEPLQEGTQLLRSKVRHVEVRQDVRRCGGQ